jgi:hypothetical protein
MLYWRLDYQQLTFKQMDNEPKKRLENIDTAHTRARAEDKYETLLAREKGLSEEGRKVVLELSEQAGDKAEEKQRELDEIKRDYSALLDDEVKLYQLKVDELKIRLMREIIEVGGKDKYQEKKRKELMKDASVERGKVIEAKIGATMRMRIDFGTHSQGFDLDKWTGNLPNSGDTVEIFEHNNVVFKILVNGVESYFQTDLEEDIEDNQRGMNRAEEKKLEELSSIDAIASLPDFFINEMKKIMLEYKNSGRRGYPPSIHAKAMFDAYKLVQFIKERKIDFPQKELSFRESVEYLKSLESLGFKADYDTNGGEFHWAEQYLKSLSQA